MKTLLKKFDMYGYQAKFMVGEKGLYTSVTGGIISVLVITFGIFYLVYTFIPFYQRENYIVTSNSKLTKLEDPFFLKNETEMEFKFTLSKDSLSKEQNIGDIIEKYFEVCLVINPGRKYLFSNSAYKREKELVLDLNFTNSSNIIAKEVDFFNFIFVEVRNKTPYDNPEMRRFLENVSNSFVLDVSYLINYIDFDDYGNTIKEYFVSRKINVDLTQKNIIATKTVLSKNEFYSDNGLLLSSPEITYFLSYDRTEVFYLPNDPDLIFRYYINYERTYSFKIIYEKFPNILAKLSAFITLINKLFAFIFNYIYSFTLKISTIRNTTKNFDNFDPFHFIQIFKKISNDNEKIQFYKNNNTSHQIETQNKNNFLFLNRSNLSSIQFNNIKRKKKRFLIILR
jgi:hypothetical protein